MKGWPKLAYVSVEVLGQVLLVESPGPLPHPPRATERRRSEKARVVRVALIFNLHEVCEVGSARHPA
jgi:hypothetical protein